MATAEQVTEDHTGDAADWQMNARHRADVIYLLTHVGSFTDTDAAIYADGWRCRPIPDLVLEQAVAYDNLGLTASQAMCWHQNGFYAQETQVWLEAGYTAVQATELVLLVADGDIDGWLDSGLTSTQVLTLARAGIRPWEADDVLEDPSMTPETLPFLAAILAR